jgi:hypothetical protein
MTTKPDDGGPAFPFEFEDHQVDGPSETLVHAGMSLQDYFAGQVLAGMAARASLSVEPADRLADRAYAIADAMLRARQS